MNTILTDDERPDLPSPVYGPDTQVDEDSDGAYTVEQMEAYADDREAAVLAKLAQQEPVAWHTEDHLTDRSATTYSKEAMQRWKGKGWPVTPLYTHPAPQQADRQRVPHWQPIDTAPIATEVIVWSDFDGVCAGMLDSYAEWYSPNSEYKLTRVRMWMPLPAAPDAASEAPAQCDTRSYCASVQRCTADDERRASTPAQASAVDERWGDNECRPLENAKHALGLVKDQE